MCYNFGQQGEAKVKVKLLLGRAGTGKTFHCLQSIRAELKRSQRGSALILLTPEQATFQMDTALLADEDISGYSRAHVVSFRRLAYLVFQEVGGPPLPPAGNIARQILISRILRQKRDELTIFGGAAHRPGLAARIAETITEFHRYRHIESHLETQLESLKRAGKENTTLALKLRDLLIIYRAYHEAMSTRYSDPDDFLDILCEKIPQSRLLRNALIWVDGFAGFTPQQYAVIEELIKVCNRMEIALCMDPAAAVELPSAPDELDPASLFHPTEETFLLLKQILAKLRIKPEISRLDDTPRFRNAPSLAHIEANIFTTRPDALKGVPQNVTITAAANHRVEVNFIARQILTLCRERGYRFRDIAVVLRSGEQYHHLIETTFAEYGIPFFIDRRREVTYHPVVETIRSALKCLLSDWSLDSVLNYAKSGLLPVEQDKIDLVENYAREHGINHSAWYDAEPWKFRRRENLDEDLNITDREVDAERLNQWRSAIIRPLLNLQNALNPDADLTVSQCCRAVYNFLRELNAAQTIEQWRRQAEKEGDLDTAEEHAHIWNELMKLLDEMVELMGDEPVSLEDFFEILETALSGLTLGLVPPSLDEVLVATIDRSRHPEIRAAFVVGMSEGQFPLVASPDPIFNDSERKELARSGFALGPTREQQLYHERFLAYIAFTRPSEILHITYPEADESGRKMNPSVFIAELRRCLPDLPVQKIAADENSASPYAIWNTRQLAGSIAATFRTASENPKAADISTIDDLAALYNDCIVENDHADDAVEMILSSLFYSNRPETLPASVLRRLYPRRRIWGSISQFECYASCPFKFFARYILKLEPREEYAISVIDLGVLYHAILRRVVQQIIDSRRDWRKLEESYLDSVVDEALRDIAPRLKDEILMSDGRSRFIHRDAAATVKRMMRVLVQQVNAGEFRPFACELGFGRDGDRLPALSCRFDDGITLEIMGRIDRIDVAEKDGALFVKVVDYKSGKVAPVLPEIVQGVHFQLPVYMLVLLTHGQRLFGRQPQPAAALLSPVRDAIEPIKIEEYDEEAVGLDIKKYRNHGFISMRCIPLLDKELQTGVSLHYAFRINADGNLGNLRSTEVLPDKLIGKLLNRTKSFLEKIAGGIVRGEIPIFPLRMGNINACSTCEYASFCRFDATRERFHRIARTTIKEAQEDLGWESDGK